MPLVAVSIKLDRIREELLYRDPGGGVWLSAVCTLDEDSRGRMVVAQSIDRSRYAAGEKGPALGTWRQIGGGNHASSGKPAFDLAKFKAAATQHKATGDGKYPPGQEGLCPSPQAAFDATLETQREPQSDTRHGSLEGTRILSVEAAYMRCERPKLRVVVK